MLVCITTEIRIFYNFSNYLEFLSISEVQTLYFIFPEFMETTHLDKHLNFI